MVGWGGSPDGVDFVGFLLGSGEEEDGCCDAPGDGEVAGAFEEAGHVCSVVGGRAERCRAEEILGMFVCIDSFAC